MLPHDNGISDDMLPHDNSISDDMLPHDNSISDDMLPHNNDMLHDNCDSTPFRHAGARPVRRSSCSGCTAVRGAVLTGSLE
jgi:hypothetical protein